MNVRDSVNLLDRIFHSLQVLEDMRRTQFKENPRRFKEDIHVIFVVAAVNRLMAWYKGCLPFKENPTDRCFATRFTFNAKRLSTTDEVGRILFISLGNQPSLIPPAKGEGRFDYYLMCVRPALIKQRPSLIIAPAESSLMKESTFRRSPPRHPVLAWSGLLRQGVLSCRFVFLPGFQVWHAKLLDKLSSIGISGRLYQFVQAFLADRRISVRVGASLSDEHILDMGVPQGSVIAPTLFSVMLHDIEAKGISTCALIDTGSQVTTVTESFYCQHLKDSSNIQPAQFLTLRAANGLEVPYVGIVVVDLVVCGQTVEAVPVLVTKDYGNPEKLKVPVLLGMNVLQRITGNLASSDFPPVLQPLMQEVKLETRSLRGVARVAGGCCIPAYSAATIKITSTQKSCAPLLASPLAQPLPRGLLLIPTLVSDQPSQRYVRLVNITSEDCILHARTPVAQLHAASCFEGQDIQVRANCSQLTVDIERVSTDPAAPGTVPCPDFDGDDEDRQQLQQLLDRYAHVFAQDDTLGYTDIVQHRIPTTDNVPVSQPYRSIPPTQLQEVKEHLQGLLQSGAIAPSHSPYAAYYRRFIAKFAKLAGPLHDLVAEASKGAKKTTIPVT
ncbi:hypothetical protein BaRGS_00023664, partial [Batillaria attramentaria]